MRCDGSWSEMSAGSAKRRRLPAGARAKGCAGSKEGGRGRRSESVERTPQRSGPEGRGQSRERGEASRKARPGQGQHGPFSSDLRPLQHEGLGAPGAAPGLALRVSPRVTWSLPTPHSSCPATLDAPFPQQVIAFALAVPTAWGAPPSALPSDTTYPASLWPPKASSLTHSPDDVQTLCRPQHESLATQSVANGGLQLGKEGIWVLFATHSCSNL